MFYHILTIIGTYLQDQGSHNKHEDQNIDMEHEMNECNFENDGDNIASMVHDTFDIAENLHTLAQDDNPIYSDFEASTRANDEASSFARIMDDGKKSIYEGCKLSKLSTVLLLYNLKVVHGWSETSFNELLMLLKFHLLPLENELPSSTYEAKKIVKSIGLEHHVIHACPNDCILYRGERANLDNCPHCSESRWKDAKMKVPHKSVRHFPIIPRLLRLYK